MDKVINSVTAHRRLLFLVFLLFASFLVFLRFSSFSWAINPVVKSNGDVKITNIKNGDIIPNKKDVVVEYSAEGITMPNGGIRYFGKIRYLILTVNGEPYGTYENNQDKGTYTFKLDLSKLEDETPVKLQVLGYLHTAPKSIIRLWEQKRLTTDRLVQMLKNLAQFKSEESNTTKDNNPNDLPKGVNIESIRENGFGLDMTDSTREKPESGQMKWKKYEYAGDDYSSVPKFSIDYPSTWWKAGTGSGGLGFAKPNVTTGVSINTLSRPSDENLNNYIQKQKQSLESRNYQCISLTTDNRSSIKCSGLVGADRGPYLHEGDKEEIVLIPYEASNKFIFIINFINDKYDENNDAIWTHILSSFHIQS